MTTLEIHLDDETVERARAAAAATGTTLEEHLASSAADLAKFDKEQERERMVTRLLEISKRSNAKVGPITWSRDDIYDR